MTQPEVVECRSRLHRDWLAGRTRQGLLGQGWKAENDVIIDLS
jgi:hypothetical protein